jgi:cell division protein FtsW
MGSRTLIDFVGKLGVQVPEDKGRKPVHLGLDAPLLIMTVTLVIYGLVMVYSASWDFAYRATGDSMYTFKRQLIWLVLGIVTAIGLSLFNYRFWKHLVVGAMVFTIGALFVVLVLDNMRLGASRGLIGGSIQPSELAKLVIILYLAVWLDSHKEELKSISLGLLPLGTILGVVGGLILLQPDLSAVMTIFILGGMMFFLAGGELKQILIILLLGMIVVYFIYILPTYVPVFTTGRERITDFINGMQNLLHSSDHVKRSLEAFAKGGWFGVGIGKSTTKMTGLPFPHTDSIFAVVGEELGVFGALVLVLLYVGMVWRGLKVSHNAPDRLGKLLAGGLAFWLATEATINMAVMVGLMPFAGNALPFISSGGSSLVMMMSAVGILTNISRQSVKKQEEERSFSAVVDLRGRDRRRRVSRIVRPSSTINRR